MHAILSRYAPRRFETKTFFSTNNYLKRIFKMLVFADQGIVSPFPKSLYQILAKRKGIIWRVSVTNTFAQTIWGFKREIPHLRRCFMPQVGI